MRRQFPPPPLLLLLAVLPLSALAAGEWNPIKDVHDPHVKEIGEFAVATVGRKLATGRWVPIKDVHDPHVQAIAKFAVSTFNSRNHTNLVFKDIRRGETQADGGTKYFLHLLMAQPSSPCYAALVLEKPKQQSLDLLSFDGDTC